MKRTVHACLTVAVLLALVACAPATAPAAPAAAEPSPTEQPPPTTKPAGSPTEKRAPPPTATDEPAPTPQPEPTATPKRAEPPEPTPTPQPEPAPAEAPAPTVEPPQAAGWNPQPSGEPCAVSETRTCKILYVLVDKYDDEHVIKTQPTFERYGYTTAVASNTLEEVRGFHECYDFTPAYPELLLEEVQVADYDAVLFCGGDGVSIDLHEDPAAHRIAREAMEREMVVAAAGDGPVILAKAGLFEGRRVTVLHNVLMHGIMDQWLKAIERKGAIYVDGSPVRDDRLVTAALVTSKFAQGIIEVLQEQ